MSDDERIARLTELARRVWPNAAVNAWGDAAWVERHAGEYPCLSVAHPRAHDALEAALLVLAHGRETVVQTLSRMSAPRITPKHVAAAREHVGRLEELRAWYQVHIAPHENELAERTDEPPAWVEQLAQEWEAFEPDVVPGQDGALRHCARELRKRAKSTY